MGVPGLWDILAPAGRSRSLAKLAVDGFESNSSGKRAYRVGIDASLWYKHAAYSKGGENPELRLLFFRIKSLTRLPLLPLFVFDGRWGRPKMKRGNRMGKSGTHSLTRNLKCLLDIFGIEWREAKGEAEAELAFLNSVGIIDAIMTDDVDAFLFGATTIIRNSSLTLTGNRSNPATNLDGKPSNDHVMEFRIEDIQSHPETLMSRGGMILFALLTGGDYDNGVDKIGKVTAHALVRCGFGDELYLAIRNRDMVSLHNFLPAWRERINTELRENTHGFLRRVAPGLCLPSNFPNLELLDKYVRPQRNEGAIQGIWKDKELNLPRLAAFCEEYFEWGTRAQVIKRFRSLIWEASVIRVLRKAALEQDKKEVDAQYHSGIPCTEINHCRRPELHDAVGTSVSLLSRYLKKDETDRTDIDRRISAAFVNRGPVASNSARLPDNPKSFIIKIHSERRHVSTDRSLEYRIEVDPEVLVQLTNSGIKGTRAEQGNVISAAGDDGGESEGTEDEENTRKKRKPKEAPNPLSTFRMWCSAPMILRVNPALIDEYEDVKEEKKQRVTRKASGTRGTASNRRGKDRRRARDADTETDTETEDDSPQPSPPKRRRAVASEAPSQNSSTITSARREDPLSSVAPSGSASCPARTASSLGASTRSSAVSSASASATGPVIRATSSNHVIDSTFRDSMGSTDVRASQARSHSIAPQKLLGSDEGWHVHDSSSLFLFSIPDPCDPDFIEREDLRNRPPEPVFRWTDMSSGITKTYDRDEDDGFASDDSELDRAFQLDFIRKAEQTNKDYVLGGRRKITGLPVSEPDSPTPKRSLSASTNIVEGVLPQITSSISGAPRYKPTSSALHHDSLDSRRPAPLFLPSRSSSPVHVLSSLSQEKSSHRVPATQDSDMIALDSSDEDCDFPSSSFDPPPSYLSSSSPVSSRHRGNAVIGKESQLSPRSQDSGIALCDGDEYLDLTHL